jgi:hypothetical protein
MSQGVGKERSGAAGSQAHGDVTRRSMLEQVRWPREDREDREDAEDLFTLIHVVCLFTR